MTNIFGRAPMWFNQEKRQIREELIAQAPPGLWLSIDRVGIEIIAVLVARCRSADATPTDHRQLLSMLERFGLTPRSRTRIMAANARKAAKRRSG